MKTRVFLFAILAMMSAGCCPTRIVTVSPNVSSRTTYSTSVTFPRTRTVTTTTHVYAADNDICLYLDLQAVGAAFGQSSTVEEFEMLLNNSSYMLSNLDLNGDGYIDYLRVLETVEGRNHIFLIQAVLAANVYQDVATIVAEMYSYNNAYVQIIGAPYIYGPKYIVQPVFHTTPLLYRHLLRVAYKPWHSPWYWGHFPSHYRRPAPIHLGHYQSYINTFMHNHKYCHKVEYVPDYHYPDYDKVTKSAQRNDYGQQHPERSFVVRTADTPSDNGRNVSGQTVTAKIVNARDIRERQAASSVTTTVPKTTSASSRRTSTTAGTPASRSATSAASGTSTTRSTTSAGEVSRSTTQRNQPVTVPQTTVKSRVSTSGSSSTRTSTVSSSGEKTTVRRGTESARATATPSSASTSRSSSASSSRSSSASTSRSASTTRR